MFGGSSNQNMAMILVAILVVILVVIAWKWYNKPVEVATSSNTVKIQYAPGLAPTASCPSGTTSELVDSSVYGNLIRVASRRCVFPDIGIDSKHWTCGPGEKRINHPPYCIQDPDNVYFDNCPTGYLPEHTVDYQACRLIGRSTLPTGSRNIYGINLECPANRVKDDRVYPICHPLGYVSSTQ